VVAVGADVLVTSGSRIQVEVELVVGATGVEGDVDFLLYGLTLGNFLLSWTYQEFFSKIDIKTLFVPLIPQCFLVPRAHLVSLNGFILPPFFV